MADEFLSFEQVLKELQVQEGELRSMVSQGRLRAFRDENTLKFRRSDVETLRAERATEPTDVVQPQEAAGETEAAELDVTPAPEEPGVQPVSEEPIDLLADEILDYDDTAETLIGGEDTSETELEMPQPEGQEPGAPADTSTGVPTIELTPSEEAADETTVPSLELSEDTGLEDSDTGSETEVPTMVLGLDEYDDTQVATEEVATEEVYIDESELGDSAAATAELEAEAEEPYVAPEEIAEVEEAEEAIGSISASSGFGTGSGEALVRREAPSTLFTVMSAIAAVILLVPGSICFYCMVSNQVPKWGILRSVMEFVWEQFQISPPGAG
jgi:hypothetical protein